MEKFLQYGFPWFLGTVGLILGISAMFAPLSGEQRLGGFGLASSAIAGACGFARSPDTKSGVGSIQNADTVVATSGNVTSTGENIGGKES